MGAENSLSGFFHFLSGLEPGIPAGFPLISVLIFLKISYPQRKYHRNFVNFDRLLLAREFKFGAQEKIDPTGSSSRLSIHTWEIGKVDWQKYRAYRSAHCRHSDRPPFSIPFLQCQTEQEKVDDEEQQNGADKVDASEAISIGNDSSGLGPGHQLTYQRFRGVPPRCQQSFEAACC